MGRCASKFLRQLVQVDPVPSLKRDLSHLMLLPVVFGAKAHDPAIGGLQADATISPGANMWAFDLVCAAAGDAAGVGADPSELARTHRDIDTNAERRPRPCSAHRSSCHNNLSTG